MTLLPWFYENASVLSRDDREDGSIHLQLAMTAQAMTELGRLKASQPGLAVQ